MSSHSDSPARDRLPPWLFASSVCLFGFVVLTWLMLTSEGLQELDREVALTCKAHAASHPALHGFFLVFTHLGGRVFLAVLAVVGVLALAWRKYFFLAGIWILATGGGALLNLAVKSTIDRQRPEAGLRDPSVSVQHDSYPSGHAMGSTVGFGMCLYAGLLGLRRRQFRGAWTVGLVMVVGLIGFSRVYLRAHWLSDIFAGFMLGAAWLLLCLGIYQRCRPILEPDAPAD